MFKKRIKTKVEIEEEKLKALKENNGNIRRALYSLGLSDGGHHYSLMKQLKIINQL